MHGESCTLADQIVDGDAAGMAGDDMTGGYEGGAGSSHMTMIIVAVVVVLVLLVAWYLWHRRSKKDGLANNSNGPSCDELFGDASNRGACSTAMAACEGVSSGDPRQALKAMPACLNGIAAIQPQAMAASLAKNAGGAACRPPQLDAEMAADVRNLADAVPGFADWALQTSAALPTCSAAQMDQLGSAASGIAGSLA